MNLTQPAMLCFGKVPDDPVFRHHFLEVTSQLQAYKEVLSPLILIILNILVHKSCLHIIFVPCAFRPLPVNRFLVF